MEVAIKPNKYVIDQLLFLKHFGQRTGR